MSEKRRARRLAVSLAAEVYTRAERIIDAEAENMSETGVCLWLDEALAKDDLVGVSLFPTADGIADPDVEPINLPARVVWCDHGRGPRVMAGMQFVDPPKR